ncbi:hypothetical protein HK405_015558, partial [Cladochytrium tenue]
PEPARAESTLAHESRVFDVQDKPPIVSWEMRITSTGRMYFVDHNSKITTWDDPRLPSSLDGSESKYKRDFRRKLVCVMRHPASDLRKRLRIRFHGEEGLDYGGVSRKFFLVLSRKMFSPFYGLFEFSNHNLQINPHSGASGFSTPSSCRLSTR